MDGSEDIVSPKGSHVRKAMPRAERCLRTLAVVGLIASLTAGCADADVDVLVAGDPLSADLSDKGCDALLPWSPDLASVSVHQNLASFRFVGERAVALGDNDFLSLVVRDYGALRQNLGVPIAVTPGLDDDAAGAANASLSIRHTCQTDVSLVLEGSVTVTAIGTKDGDRVRGSFEGVFLDGRDLGIILIDNVEATFDFRYRESSPFQPFPGSPND